MIKPQYWLKHRQARRAVIGYPVYDMPHKGEAAEGELTETEVEENFEYFMRVRRERLAFFRDWMNRHFHLALSLDGNSVVALEAWLWDYGGGLLEDRPNIGSIYACNEPRWEGALAGYNVAIDAAILVGEFLLSRRANLYWTHRAYSVSARGHYVESRLHHPFIGGFPIRTLASDPIYETFATMKKSLWQSKIGEPRYRAPRTGIVYDCRSNLYLANVPEPKYGEVFTFGDYSNEPL
jgi:hypothetical protein